MLTKSIYRLSDGLLTGQQVSLEPWDEEKAKTHLPAGHGFIDGAHHHLSKRVDTKTSKVIDHTLKADPVQVRQDAVLALARLIAGVQTTIEALEAKQHRPIRELHLDPSNASAREKLGSIDKEIASHRSKLDKLRADLVKHRVVIREP